MTDTDKSLGGVLERVRRGVPPWLLNTVVVIVSGALVNVSGNATGWLQGWLFDEPWQVLWVLLPLVGAAAFAWRRWGADWQGALDARWMAFLCVYCALFGAAGVAELAVWSRTPTHVGGLGGQADAAPSTAARVLSGDWRYGLVPPAPPHVRPWVLLLDPLPAGEATREVLRWRDRKLVEIARRGDMAVIAFDVAFEGPSAVDAQLCRSVERAWQEGTPVLSAYEQFTSAAAALAAPTRGAGPVCLRGERRGHAMGLADGDGRIRSLPLYWDDNLALPAFALRVAQCIVARCDPKAQLPGKSQQQPRGDRLLRFVAPVLPIEVLEGDAAVALLAAAEPDALQGRILIVGERSSRDTFATPFGALPGVLVHAYAVESLVSGQAIHRPPPGWSVFAVFAACFVLTLVAHRGASLLRLLTTAALLHVLFAVLAATAMRFMLVWLDVVYAAAAVWLLVPLLWLARRYAPEIVSTELGLAAAAPDNAHADPLAPVPDPPRDAGVA